jgi:hypothetical protein
MMLILWLRATRSASVHLASRLRDRCTLNYRHHRSRHSHGQNAFHTHVTRSKSPVDFRDYICNSREGP